MLGRNSKLLKNFNVNVDADANADAGGTVMALPGLQPGELKSTLSGTMIDPVNILQSEK